MPLSADPVIAAELRRNSLFAALGEEEFARVLAACQRHELEPDQSLFEQGRPAEQFFLLRRGLMKLSRLSPAGDEKVIELVQAGQTFAEALMFSGKSVAYPVTARAIEPSEVLAFDSRAFLALLKASPGTCLAMLAGMSRRMRALVEEIDRLALQSATARLADFLLANAEDGKVALRTPKNVLASRLSIQPETLSRIFARLAAEGVLEVQGAQIVLHRPEELQRMSSAAGV
ncbi:MAG: Crp/Fnr family transcriptional regulator [Thiohalomonadaceae bacterium]